MSFKFNPFTGNFDQVNPLQDLSGYVPYLGATSDVDLDTFKLTASEFQVGTAYPIKTGTIGNEIIIGQNAFNSGSISSGLIAIGAGSGAYSTNLFQSVLIGKDAGISSTVVANSLGIGERVFEGCNTAVGCVAIGSTTCYGLLNTSSAIGIGNSAASTEFGGATLNNAIMIGQQAGWESYNASRVIAIGYQSCYFDTVDNNTTGGWNILLGDYTGTSGFQNSIAVGSGAANSASAQCNIGNTFYIDGIYTAGTQSSTPLTTAKFGFGTDTPQATVDIVGDITTDAGTNKWKLKGQVTSAAVFDTTQWVEIEINGVTYKLALVL